jgi:(1->4)-alpha-D-glucan 1-alpha-D-glucosylmutase
MTRMRATYRLQLHGAFTFADAEAQVPYLRALGVSHLYLSPIGEAHPGSMHFYDQVDPTRVSEALGGEKGFRSLARACKEAGLGIILDIVPNHMGTGPDNPYWMEMLEFGRKAPSAALFDVDWSEGRVHLAALGGRLEECLARGEFSLALDPEPRIVLRYYEHAWPLRPASASALFAEAATACGDKPASEIAAAWAECDAFPPRPEALKELRARLTAQLAQSEDWRAAVEKRLAEAQEPTHLALLLESQHWQLAHWRTAATDLNYRRFFNISTLAGLRVEDPDVFELVHRLPLGLVNEGYVSGLRVDHIDGLADPAGYCERLRAGVGPDAALHVEKILASEEMLPDWPVNGTTGYEMLNLINGVFVDADGYEHLRKHARGRLGVTGTPHERVRAAKTQLLKDSFATELDSLVTLAATLSDGVGREETENALVRFIAACPVYRTYLTDAEPDAHDATLIASLLAELDAPQRAVAMLRKLLSGKADEKAAEFRRRLQQLTGPVMAKGYEDTELYRHVVLLSANEVGGSVAAPALSADLFHDRVRARASFPPLALRATSPVNGGGKFLTLVPLATHDTKRGSDTRARLNVLSECAEDWIAATDRWTAMNKTLRGDVSPADEAFLYQTLVSVWPVERERMDAVMLKSIREARLRTSWEHPDAAYEKAMTDFLRALLTEAEGEPFRAGFVPFAERIAAAGRRNSINQTVLQLTMPGVPDIYQGTELWDYSLVDPDNRRAVDWDTRTALLNAKPDTWDDTSGVGKQALIRRLLALRAELPELFASGVYVPVPAPENMLAFARASAADAVLVMVATRALTPPGNGTRFAVPKAFRGRWTDVLTERSMELSADTRLDVPLPLVLKRAEQR